MPVYEQDPFSCLHGFGDFWPWRSCPFLRLCWFLRARLSCSFRCDALFSSELLFSEKSFWLTVLDGIEMWFVLCVSTSTPWGNNISKPNSVLKSQGRMQDTESAALNKCNSTRVLLRGQKNCKWYKVVCRGKVLYKVLNKRIHNSPRIRFYYFSVSLRLLPKLPNYKQWVFWFVLIWAFFFCTNLPGLHLQRAAGLIIGHGKIIFSGKKILDSPTEVYWYYYLLLYIYILNKSECMCNVSIIG